MGGRRLGRKERGRRERERGERQKEKKGLHIEKEERKLFFPDDIVDYVESF